MRALLGSPRAAVFDRIVGELEVEPAFAAVVLVQRFKHCRREGLAVDGISDAEIYEVFQAYREGRLSREGVPEVLRLLAELPPADEPEAERVAAVFVSRRIKPLTDVEIHHIVREHLGKLGDRVFATPEQKCRYLVGQVLKEYMGCVDGRRLVAWVCNRLKVPPPVLVKTGRKPQPQWCGTG